MGESWLDRAASPLTNESMAQNTGSALDMIYNNNIYYLYFSNLAMNLFEWENLPETMDGDFLEWSLFVDGRACFVRDPILGNINLRYSENSKPNIYNLPTTIRAYSNDYSRTCSKDEFVIVKNNIQYIPTALYVDHFCKIISNIEQTMQINLQAQKTPITFTGTEDQILALKNTYKKYVGNDPYIFASQKFNDAIKIEALTTGAPFLVDKLQAIKKDYKAEFMSFLGVNSVEEKKERLLADEVNSNNQFISLNFETMYKERQKAADEYNKRFGTNIKVIPKVGSMILDEDKTEQDSTDSVDIKGDNE